MRTRRGGRPRGHGEQRVAQGVGRHQSPGLHERNAELLLQQGSRGATRKVSVPMMKRAKNDSDPMADSLTVRGGGSWLSRPARSVRSGATGFQ